MGARGSLGRTDWTFPLDVHADYTWKFGEQKRLRFIADLFNIGNQQRAISINQFAELTAGTPNPDLRKPAGASVNNDNFANAYQQPFQARLAVRFEF